MLSLKKNWRKHIVDNRYFVHLHTHCEHSLLDGMGKPEQYAKRAKELGYEYLAITDHGDVAGTLKWQDECKKEGIIPIIGMEAYVCQDARDTKEKPRHLTMLVQNETGWHNLLKMCSYAHLVGFHKRPRVDYEQVLKHSDGLIFMSGCVNSVMKPDHGEKFFCEDLADQAEVYIEIMPHNHPLQIEWNLDCLEISEDYGIPLVATHDCFIGDTVIYTKDGTKLIRDIRNGDIVITHNGNFQKIKRVGKREVKKSEKIFSIKTTLGSLSGGVSENHPYFTCKYNTIYKTMYDFKWKRVKDLDNTDYLISPKIKRDIVFSKHDLTKIDLVSICGIPCGMGKNGIVTDQFGNEYFNTTRSIEKGINIPRYLPVNKSLLEIIGMYIANGNVDGYNIGFSTHIDKKWQIDIIIDYFTSFGFSPYIVKKENCIAAIITSSVFSKFFCKVCGNGARNKHLPYINGVGPFNLFSEKQMSRILFGYITSDGRIIPKKSAITAACTTSKILCYEIMAILNAIGIISLPMITTHQDTTHKNPNANPSQWKNLYSLNVTGYQYVILCRFLEIENTLSTIKCFRKRYVENSLFFGVKLSKIQIVDLKEPLYNMEVENDNSYIANGLAVHNCHYVLPEDEESQEVLLAIQRGAKWNDPNRWKFDFHNLHLATADEMISGFSKQKLPRSIYIPAMKRTVEIARKCSGFQISKQEVHLPLPPSVTGDEFAFLENLCVKGYYDKIGSLFELEYEQRMDYELSVIKSKGFVRYFLIVWDFINWVKKHSSVYSPGRGSAAGSLVTYLVGITGVDPIKYGLLFSRFINEERIDLPDIDMDIPDTLRGEAIQYLRDTYGNENVAGISTFLKMKARLVIRDVARVFDIDLKEVDTFAKSVDKSVQDAIDLEVEQYQKKCEEIDNNKRDKEREKKKEDIKQQMFHYKHPDVIKHALKLEGQCRGYSRHAAGAVISNESLSDGRQTYLAERGNNIVVGWDMSDCEHAGLLKLDVLGLKTLTVLNYAHDLIKENYNLDLDYSKIPLDDPKVYEALNNGNFTGIFQMGWAIQDVIRKSKVNNILEWSDAVALGRPGPANSGMLDEYIRRKNGGNWEKKHPIYEEVTKDTFSCITYQEQVMNIFHKVAGLPYPIADKIRKIIGKKRDAKEFEPYKDMFAKGCYKQRTMSEKEVNEFWEGLLEHASYSFNLSHALSYSVLGYWTLYTKVYYPTEYVAAFLTYGTEKHIPEMIKDARSMGLQLIPPKIGISDALRWKADGNKLYLPFNAIHGVGEKMAVEIAAGGRIRKKGKKLITEERSFTPSVQTTLENIRAFDPHAKLPKEALRYFDFELLADPREAYPKLLKILGRYSQNDDIIESALRGEFELSLCVQQSKFKLNGELLDCRKCGLRAECARPVSPSPSDHNMMIIAEAPGAYEDRQGVGLVGPAGKVIWSELGKYDLDRTLFHVTNTCKCFPKKTKTPNKEHVEACSGWLKEEIEQVKPFIILASGKTAMYFFTGEDKGITKKNATIEWNEDYGCYVCYCLHPASILHSNKNKSEFERGIKFFSDKVQAIGGI